MAKVASGSLRVDSTLNPEQPNQQSGRLPRGGLDHPTFPQVQAELRRKWRRWHLKGILGSKLKYHHPSGGSNGATCSTQVSMLTRVSPGARRSSSFQAEVSLV